MTATYNETLPTDLDKCRSRLGDTTVEPDELALHSDEHIQAVLDWKGSVDAAVVYLAQELIAKYGMSPIRKSAHGVSLDYTENLKLWRQIAGEALTASAGGALSFVTANYTGEATADEYARPPDYWP